MPMDQLHPIGRRQLLGAACATAAGLVFPVSASAAIDRLRRPAEVAVLMPTFTRQPLLVEQYLDGLQLALKAEPGQTVRLRLVPYRGHASAVARTVETLLRESPPDLITGLFSPDVGATTSSLLQRHQVPMLVCDLGADRLPAMAPHPLLAGQSLELAHSSAALGHWAPGQLGTRAVLAMGLAESGHDFPHEFRKAFEAQGGTVVATHVSGVPGRASEFEGLQEVLRQHRPDFVLALYAGPQKQRLEQVLDLTGQRTRTPIVSMDLDRLVSGRHASSTGLSFGSWLHAPTQCDRFQGACADAKFSSSAFTVLGFEAGERILGGLAARDSAGFAWPDQTQGPRGLRQHQASCLACSGPSWLEAHGVATELATAPALPAATHVQFSQDGSRVAASGWLNSYLFN